MFTSTTTTRDMQRTPKRLLKQANEVKKPIIVISNSKPLGAIIGLELLEKLQLQQIVSQAQSELKKGKTTLLSTKEDIDNYLDKMANE